MPRYIDAERMREDWLENGENEYVYDTNAVLESIDRQPTADVVEVVHGEWIDNHCSICGMTPLGEEFWEHLDLEPPKFEYYMNYCPECGAKMDKKKIEYKNYILKDKIK